MEAVLQIPSITGVDVELKVAGPGARSYAFVIDWHIRVLAAIAWFLAAMFAVAGGVAFVPSTDSAYVPFLYVAVLPSIAIYVLYHPVLEVVLHGQTPGKRMAGVRLVTAAGGTPGVGALLIRNIFRLIDCLPSVYAVGLLTTFLTKHAQRVGDIAAGTILVYDEKPSAAVLEELSGSAVAALGLEQAQVVRDLLSRWKELAPNARDRLARKLLAKLRVDCEGATDAELQQRLREVLS
ncbi:MAG TPA: RDD family protein [Gammaproteobacteria bacterium]|nr:RDD family protein [Gammaproteobacteria bacterium]